MKLVICRPPKLERRARRPTARTKRISNHDMLTVMTEWEREWKAKRDR